MRSFVARLIIGAAAAAPAVLAAASNKTCVNELMCITATVNATTTLYEVEATSKIPPGWMAIGFGTKMAGSPMVVMWVNDDKARSVTLSQRVGTGHVMPSVVARPPRAATLVQAQTTINAADNPVVVFTMPNAEGDALTDQKLIWAMSYQKASGPQTYAQLGFHDAGYGTTTLAISGVPESAPSSGTSSSPSPTSTASPAPTASGPTAMGATSGGSACVGDPQIMCIAATLNSTSTLYALTVTASTIPGWVGLGFGQQMAGSSMVVLSNDGNGGAILSQRTSSGHVMPAVDKAPVRVATLDTAQSSVLSSQPVFAFAIPNSGAANAQKLIWAASSSAPAADGTIQFHDIGYGALVLDASAPLAADGAPTAPTQVTQLPELTLAQKYLVAHAVLFAAGFLVLLPVGALVARLLRTSVPWWFRVHWIVQFYISGPIMIAAFALGVSSIEMRGGTHFDTFHKKLGLAIFALYFAQCALGGIIHFVKNPNRTRRPGQNYLHAILGLTIIGLALAQVRSGYAVEWPRATQRAAPGVNGLFIAWCIALPVLYFGGLSLLGRQFRQEREAREAREMRDKTPFHES